MFIIITGMKVKRYFVIPSCLNYSTQRTKYIGFVHFQVTFFPFLFKTACFIFLSKNTIQIQRVSHVSSIENGKLNKQKPRILSTESGQLTKKVSLYLLPLPIWCLSANSWVCRERITFRVDRFFPRCKNYEEAIPF